jgi:plasmid stabilization system protein ParE
MRLVWLPEAQADIQRLYNFLRERDPRAAERAIRAMQLGAQRLLEFPHLGRRIDDETERREVSVPFGAGAYILRYRMHDETIVVLRVWHSREGRA